jgi:Subtilisin-like serine proteases
MRKALVPWLVPLLLLAACSRTLESPEEPQPSARAALEQEPTLVPGTLIVEFDEQTASAIERDGLAATKAGALGDAFARYGVLSAERLYPDAGEWEPRHREAGLHRWYRVRYDAEAAVGTKAAEDFGSLPGVLSAAPERRIRSHSYFNDPYANLQWALYNDGSLGSAYAAGCDINVVPVWEHYTAGSPNVIVAVLDGGVQLDHPDLAAVAIPAGADGSKSFVNGYTGYKIFPDDHGTHVAGIIAAVNNNGVGVSGVAGGRDGKGGVRILSCAFMMEDPSDPEQKLGGNEYAALVWAADHGAVIAQNSWGYVYDSEAEAMDGEVDYVEPAIDYFIKYAGCDKNGEQRADSPMKGGVVIFAAGNESWRIAWPAAYEPVIAVGAVSAKYSRAYYSNYGDWVDICAPGGDARQGAQIYSTIAGDGYEYYQGTSMACPQVSGVAALLVSYYGGPGFTNAMLTERLLGGTNRDAVSKNYLIGPLVDALGAFTYGSVLPPEPAKDVKSSVSSNDITLSWKVTSDPDDAKAYGYLLLAAKSASELKDLDPRNIPSSVQQVQVEVGTLEVGDLISATLGGLDFETTYYTTVIAYDYAGNYSEPSATLSVRTGRNNPPVVSTDYDGSWKVKPFETLAVLFTVTDPDGHDFSVEVDPGSDAFIFGISGGTVNCRIVGNRVPHGTYTAHIVATDSFGTVTDYAVEYEILENHPPVVAEQMNNLLFGTIGQTQALDMTQYFRDEDGEPLSYSVSVSAQNVVHFNPSGSSVQATVLGFGLVSVTLTATDACGATASQSFQVLVRDASRPYDLYPNPVKDVLWLRSGEVKSVDLTISNKAGAVVYEQSGLALDPFEPTAIDFKAQPGGVYYVRIGEDRYTIVKQ